MNYKVVTQESAAKSAAFPALCIYSGCETGKDPGERLRSPAPFPLPVGASCLIRNPIESRR